jgi:peptidyl-prolyl cis-trans isomerase SurA
MMRNFLKPFGLLVLTLFFLNPLRGQQDPVLFTVDEDPVAVSEFVYIYSKTNGPRADFSLPSLSEYLELYKKFKLKVRRAREMQLDTLPSLQQELAGYRKQLAGNYLIDKEVTNLLIEEAYDRMQRDVRFSHILVKLEANPAPEDTMKAWKKIQEARRTLSGKSFEQVVREFSEDETTLESGGDLGFFTAVFPNGFYDLETVAYTTPLNDVGGPVRTKLGYHLIKVTAVRDARGEMEAAHILVRKDPRAEQDVSRIRIDSIYRALRDGADFAALARELSEDRLSASKGGNIGVFGINRYEKPFEDAAFALASDGAYSAPVETSAGWHILLRVKGPVAEPLDQARRRLEPKVKRDDRFELARVSMIEKIKKDIGVKENKAVLDLYSSRQTDTLFTFLWKPGTVGMYNETIVTLGKDNAIPLSAFEEFLQRNAGKRVNLKRSGDIPAGVRLLFDEFVQDECVKYEEARLEDKYPEFRSLMREYEEGILLFEATKRVVWDKASQDSVGLAKFFAEEASSKYQWGERARVTFYLLQSQDQKLLEEVRKFAAKNKPDAVLKKFNKGDKPVLSTREFLYEHGKNNVVDQMVWKAGTLSFSEEEKRNQGWSFLKIEEIVPTGPKSLDEARGYVIADYQDKLEQEWVRELSGQYKIRVNQGVFQGLIRK